MKTRRIKSVIAVLLSISMILGSSVLAMADTVSQGQTAGIGDMEGVVSSNVFVVSIPVSSVSNDKLLGIKNELKLVI